MPSNDKKNIDSEVLRKEEQTNRQIAGERRIRIVIPSGRGDTDKSPVQVGVNGYAVMIQRDKPVDVPESVVNVLNLARERVPFFSEDNGRQVIEWRETLRHPFQILGFVDGQSGNLMPTAVA